MSDDKRGVVAWVEALPGPQATNLAIITYPHSVADPGIGSVTIKAVTRVVSPIIPTLPRYNRAQRRYAKRHEKW